jgi:hypothetical protein
MKNPEKIHLGAPCLASETWVGFRYAFPRYLTLLKMSPEPENR